MKWIVHIAGFIVSGVAAATLGAQPLSAANVLSSSPMRLQVSVADDRFPVLLDQAASPGEGTSWSPEAIAGVTRIVSTAIAENGNLAAFVVMRAFFRPTQERYALYVADLRKPGSARKLLESSFIRSVGNRPGTHDWTVLADLGKGVQLYDVDPVGAAIPVALNTATADMGGYDSSVLDASIGVRRFGVVAYGWSPDGMKLWYTTPAVRAIQTDSRDEAHVLIYDDMTMTGPLTFARDPKNDVEEMALHLRDMESATDTVLATNRIAGDLLYDRQYGTVWLTRSELIYPSDSARDGGYGTRHWHRTNVATGVNETLTAVPADPASHEFIQMAGGYAEVVRRRDGARMILRTSSGTTESVIATSAKPIWVRSGGRLLVNIRKYRDHDGLIVVGREPLNAILESRHEFLEQCDVDAAGRFAICSSEELIAPPALVRINLDTGERSIVASPNARYVGMTSLRIEAVEGVNRPADGDAGYLVYPTNYQSGERYPCIVLTHGNDAIRRRYFHPILQWAYPVQYWAEHGYFVLEANEPDAANLDAALQDAGVSIANVQEELGYKPLRSIEAATQNLIVKGYLDPMRIGIVGYSRGAWLARFALSHSKMFAAGSSGDSNLWEIGSYFMYGMRSAAEVNDRIYGGPIVDPGAYEEYRKFATTARPGEFAGPLLQQFPAATAGGAMEMHEFLRYAHVPTELAVFYGETHLLHEPASQVIAMQQNIDWFDYWLLGLRHSGDRAEQEYQRWDRIAQEWRDANR